MTPIHGIGPIQSGIPMPSVAPDDTRGNARAGRPSKYQFSSMAVGQSVFVVARFWPAARIALRNYRRQNPGWNFVAETERDGVRFWRSA